VGVEVVLCAKIGECPQDKLIAAGIATSDAYAFDYIERAIGDYYADKYGVPQLALRA
jgi:nitrogen fixation protein NifB